MSSPSQLCTSVFKGKFCPLSLDWVCATAEDHLLLFVHNGASSMTPGVCNREWQYKILIELFKNKLYGALFYNRICITDLPTKY